MTTDRAEQDLRADPADGAETGHTILLLAGILLGALVAFSPVFDAGFLNLDDYRYRTALRSLDFAGVLGLFARPFEGYQPLSLLSLGLTNLLFGHNPWIHHGVNLCFHLANTLLVFLLARAIVGRDRPALLASACFAFLPALVEPVAWVASRKDVQYAFFYLLGLLQYIRYVSAPSKRSYAAVVACFLLSVFSKGMAVSFPLSLLAVDFVIRRPWNRGRLLLDKIPFAALSVVFGVVAVAAQRAAGYSSQLPPLAEVPARMIGAAQALGLYFLHLLDPFSLAAFHPWVGQSAVAWCAGLAIGLAWAACAILALRTSRTAAFSLAFFLVNIVLVLQFIPVAEFIVADRYLYVASFGFCVAAATLLDRALDARPRSASVAAVSFLFVAMAAASFSYARDWRDSTVVWSRAIDRYPRSEFALSMRAGARVELKAYRDAIADLDRAAAASPTYSRVYLNRGVARERLGDAAGALLDYSRFSQLSPYDPQGYNNRGMLLLRLGDNALAVSNLTAAVMLGEGHPSMHMFMGNRAEARLRSGDWAGAIEDASRAIAAFPTHYRAFLIRAEATYRMGDHATAMRDIEQARCIDPADGGVSELVRRLASPAPDAKP